jgi:hypothetical protein
MKVEVSRLISLAMFMSLGGATVGASAHECGVDHVKTTRLGLKVYIQRDVSANFFSINRTGAEGATTNHSVRNGRIVPPDVPPRHGLHLFAPRYFFLDRGGSASGFNLWGGCSFEIKSDQHGMYLHVEGADGDISDAVYNEDIRPDE